MAKESGVDLKLAKVVDGYLDVVKEQKGDRGDLPGVYGAARVASGMKFENKD
jgi:hypothetical protein